MKFCRVIIFILISLRGYSQYNFARIDSFAISIGKADSLTIPQLTSLLTHKFTDPVEKTRAIYTWIAYNIAYDCPAYHNTAKAKTSAQDVYKLRKAICDGYSNLFCEMCSYANVQCLSIYGYAKNTLQSPGEKSIPEHAWNAVRINKEWKMIDVTWGSGYTDNKVKVFTQQFSDIYFFTDPYKFLLNHYPDQEDWKPPASKLSREEFFNNPTVIGGIFKHNLSNFQPKKAIINSGINKPVNISFSTTTQPRHIIVHLGVGKQQKVLTPKFTAENGLVSFSFAYDVPGSHLLTIFVNNDAVLQYQLNIQ